MPTSETAHARRERGNTSVKQHQGKVCATKAQQDLPVNMVINSRLLACKSKRGEIYYFVKPALSVDPYFHFLALF
jgi:hypothetical protein